MSVKTYLLNLVFQGGQHARNVERSAYYGISNTGTGISPEIAVEVTDFQVKRKKFYTK